MPTLQTLTKKIQKHCPELEAKKEKADALWDFINEESGGLSARLNNNDHKFMVRLFDPEISLEHVLRVMNLNPDAPNYLMSTRGHFYRQSVTNVLTLSTEQYNLSKPFSEQSEELYEWLNSIIQ